MSLVSVGLVARECAKPVREIEAYVRSCLPCVPRASQRFVLFSGGRRGSHLLMDLLGCHPDVFCDGEVFHPARVNRLRLPTRYLLGRTVGFRRKVYGCKISVNKLDFDQGLSSHEFLNGLVENNWKIVYLHREDLLRVCIAKQVAEQRGKPHRMADSPSEDRLFHIDTRLLLQDLTDKVDMLKRERDLMRQFSHLMVTYEHDLLSPVNHQATADKVFDFLGTDRASVKTRLARTGADDLSTYIANFDEVQAIARSHVGQMAARVGRNYDS